MTHLLNVTYSHRLAICSPAQTSGQSYFPAHARATGNNAQLKVWSNGKGGRKIPVPVWEVIPYPEGTKLRFKASPPFENLPISGGPAPVYKLLSLGYYTHAQRIFWACKLLCERPHIAKLLAGRFPRNHR